MTASTAPTADLYNRWQDVVKEFSDVLSRLQRERKEIQTLLGQTREELASIERDWQALQARLQHMRSHPDSYARDEIIETYDSALKHEQRLASMRESYERLESRSKEREEHSRLLGHFTALTEEVGRRLAPPEAEGAEAEAATDASSGGAHGGRWLIYSLEAQEHRQQDLARRMHDGPVQSLTNLMLEAEICERLLDRDPVQAREELERLREMVRQTFTTARDYIAELRPMSLDDLGLVPTLKRYVGVASQRQGIPVSLNLVGEERRLSPLVESSLFRAAQELIGNALSYAGAQRIDVTLQLDEEKVVLEVRDDGRGFDVPKVLEEAPIRGTWGLIGLRERVALLEGRIEIDSKAGEGTRVRLELPASFEINGEEPG